MKKYHLTLVLSSSASEANRKKILETVKSWLNNAKFTKEESWGEKTLSYLIKKEKSGFYHHLQFEMENLEKDFEKRVHTSDGVLRHLLLKQ